MPWGQVHSAAAETQEGDPHPSAVPTAESQRKAPGGPDSALPSGVSPPSEAVTKLMSQVQMLGCPPKLVIKCVTEE